MKQTPMQELIERLDKEINSKYPDGYNIVMEIAKDLAEQMLEKKAMTHDKILSMTDEFVQSNRSEGQTYAHYHYDMMADFALHILETFNTKEK